MRRLLGVLVLVLGVSDICAAIRVAQPDPVLEAWRWQVFSERDGLVSIRVRAIATEGNAIWFATDQGVSKYDGLLWETYTVADGLPSDDVLAVQVGADGVVWFGTVAGVCRFDPTKQFGTPIGLPNKAWKTYGEMEGMPGERVSDLVFGLDGRLWAATDGGAAYLDVGANEWMVYTTADGLADDEVNDLAVDADGAIWFATERGASRYDGVSWQSYRRGDGLQGTSVTSVFSDREGNVWFAQYGSGLACLKNGHWFQYTESEGLPDEGVRQVFQTKDGVIWVVCRSGIARLNAGNQWQSYHRSKLPGLGEPYTAGVDAHGAVWIGGPSSRGVVRFDYSSRRVSVYELGHTVDMSKGKGIGQDRDGAIWFGTGIGAVRFDGSSWSLAGGFRGVMSAVYGSEDGTLYLAGRDKEGPLVVATRGLAREEIRYGLSGEAVTAVTRTRDGTLWAGVKGGGLFRRNVGAGAWEVQEKRREIPRRILAMSTSADGGLWLAGRGQDLCRRSPGGMWRAFNLNKSGDIQTLLGTRSGSLWLGLGAAGGGAIRLNDVGGVEVYTVKDGLAHDEVHALVEDRQGALWAATSGGVSRFDRSRNRWVTLRGVPDLDVRDLFVARDGAIWMRTLSGDVVRYWNDGDAPQTYLENPPSTVAPEGSVNFEWQGRDRWFSARTDLEYASRIDDEPWSEFSDRHRASFASLSDGKHTFEVRARDVDLNIEMAAVVHPFVVETPIWKQSWFVGLMIALLGTIFWQTRRILIRDKALAEANARLQELDQLKTDFFSNVSHELRTPMTAIKGYVDNMLDGIAGDVTERQERYLNRVKSNADRLTRLINDLLDLSRIDRGRTDLLQLNMSPIQLNDVVHEAVDGLRPLADAAGLKLVYQGEDNLAMADRDRVIQMVTNLAGNAIKFTESGGEVRVSVRSDGTGFIQTVVKDTGKGIPAEDLSKIFDRFHQVKGTMGGTGLGLPITKELADLHGGEVWAESEMGHGSTFTFTIPEAKMG